MRLYLVQHGEAVPEEVEPTRPLGERGRADVRQMATFLAQGGVRADRVRHAGKRRAEQTAAVLAAALAPGDAPVARAGLDPGDPTDGVTREAAAWEGDVMLVGHLPFMARLASRLVAGRENAGVVALEPGSVLCLERTDQQRWRWAALFEDLNSPRKLQDSQPARRRAPAPGRDGVPRRPLRRLRRHDFLGRMLPRPGGDLRADAERPRRLWMSTSLCWVRLERDRDFGGRPGNDRNDPEINDLLATADEKHQPLNRLARSARSTGCCSLRSRSRSTTLPAAISSSPRRTA